MATVTIVLSCEDKGCRPHTLDVAPDKRRSGRMRVPMLIACVVALLANEAAAGAEDYVLEAVRATPAPAIRAASIYAYTRVPDLDYGAGSSPKGPG